MEKGISRSRLDADCAQRMLSLRRDLGVSSFGLNQMVLEPGQRGRIHRHARQEEVYLVIAGRLNVEVEQEDHELGPGELMRVAPDLRRQLANRGSEWVVLVALGGAGEHEGRDGEAFSDWEQTRGASPQEVPLPEDLDLRR